MVAKQTISISNIKLNIYKVRVPCFNVFSSLCIPTLDQPHHLPILCIIFATIKIPSTEFIWKYEKKNKKESHDCYHRLCVRHQPIYTLQSAPYTTTILNHQVPSKQTTAGIYVRGVVQRSSIVFYHLFYFSGFTTCFCYYLSLTIIHTWILHE